MKFKSYFQAGGAAGAADPLQQVLEMAFQAVQNQDGELALQACQLLVEIAQGQGAGAGAGAGAPEEAGYPEEGGEEPVYGKGGKIVAFMRRV